MSNEEERKRRRLALSDATDWMRLKERFYQLAEDVLPGEGFPDDDITNAMIRSLCSRIGDREKLMQWVKDIADMWFD